MQLIAAIAALLLGIAAIVGLKHPRFHTGWAALTCLILVACWPLLTHAAP